MTKYFRSEPQDDVGWTWL